ncbi:hypothetical protein, partial [Pedobacter sp.]|uniref:hypothetical protein n=1 Tax=Pedobacter sp. TaxID=1411316 RepID=UPI003D7F2165
MINKLKVRLLTCCLTLLCLFIYVQTIAQTTFIQHYTTQNGLPSNNCFFSLQDKQNYLWFATDAGVSRFDGKRFEN